MDTAVAVIPKSSARDLIVFLNEHLPGQAEPWLVRRGGEAVIFVNLVPAEVADLEPEDLDELRKRLQSEELTAMLADVAVRNIGCKELRELIATVVDRFSGLASDDVAEHWWTAEEIRTPGRFKLQPFWPHEVKSTPRGGSGDASQEDHLK